MIMEHVPGPTWTEADLGRPERLRQLGLDAARLAFGRATRRRAVRHRRIH